MEKTFSENINTNVNIPKSYYSNNSMMNDVQINENDSNIIKNNNIKTNYNKNKLNDIVSSEDLSDNFSLSVFGRINTNNMRNMLDYKEKVSLSNYEGFFDNYNCLCCFAFDNVFQIGKIKRSISKKYDILERKILKNFSQKKAN